MKCEHCGRTQPEGLPKYQRGDRVLVSWPSGHLEECTVEEATVWVKDASGHAHECTYGQLSKIKETSMNNCSSMEG